MSTGQNDNESSPTPKDGARFRAQTVADMWADKNIKYVLVLSSENGERYADNFESHRPDYHGEVTQRVTKKEMDELYEFTKGQAEGEDVVLKLALQRDQRINENQEGTEAE